MNMDEIEKAYNLLAMHHSELLLERERLVQQVQMMERTYAQQNIWEILKARWRNMFRLERGGW